MLHILWLAVKFIGMLLVLILAILLVAAVLVLFCPLRYRVKIRKTVDEWEAQTRASWLFGLIRVTVQKGSAGGDTQIRICGIRPRSFKKLFARKKKTRKKQPRQRREEPPAAKLEASQTEPERLPSEYLEVAEESAPVLAEASKEERKKEKQPKESFWKCNPIRKLWTRIVETCKRIRESLIKFWNTVKNMRNKIQSWKDFLGDSRTSEAFRLTKRQLFRLLRHAGPQKWEGAVNFGLEDPAATGQILAVLGALYPIHQGKFLVNPVWDRKILEGSARIKGRIYGVMLLYMAGRLFFDKNVKYVVSRFRQQAESGWNTGS